MTAIERKAIQRVRVRGSGRSRPREDAASHGRARLAKVAFLGARGKWRALVPALRAAHAECGARAVEEALLQLVLFAGYPTAIEAFRCWTGARGGAPTAPRSGGARSDWSRRGERLCARIYGAQYPALRATVARYSPELDSLMVEMGYGRVLSRPGLDVAAREVVTVAALLGARRPRQLRSHLAGCLRCGVRAGELRDLFRSLSSGLSPGARAEARKLLQEARDAVPGGGGA